MGVVAGLYMYVVVVPVLFHLWFFSYSFSYSYWIFDFYSARNAGIASAVLATAILSVRLSVRHKPVLCPNDGT